MKKYALLLLIGLLIEASLVGIVYCAFVIDDLAFSGSYVIALLVALVELVKLVNHNDEE